MYKILHGSTAAESLEQILSDRIILIQFDTNKWKLILDNKKKMILIDKFSEIEIMCDFWNKKTELLILAYTYRVFKAELHVKFD